MARKLGSNARLLELWRGKLLRKRGQGSSKVAPPDISITLGRGRSVLKRLAASAPLSLRRSISRSQLVIRTLATRSDVATLTLVEETQLWLSCAVGVLTRRKQGASGRPTGPDPPRFLPGCLRPLVCCLADSVLLADSTACGAQMKGQERLHATLPPDWRSKSRLTSFTHPVR